MVAKFVLEHKWNSNWNTSFKICQIANVLSGEMYSPNEILNWNNKGKSSRLQFLKQQQPLQELIFILLF